MLLAEHIQNATAAAMVGSANGRMIGHTPADGMEIAANAANVVARMMDTNPDGMQDENRSQTRTSSGEDQTTARLDNIHPASMARSVDAH